MFTICLQLFVMILFCIVLPVCVLECAYVCGGGNKAEPPCSSTSPPQGKTLQPWFHK